MRTPGSKPVVPAGIQAGLPPWQLGPPPPEPVTRPLLLRVFRRPTAARSRRTAYRLAVLRRLVAAALAGVAVWTVVRVLAPPPPAGRVAAVVALHDLAAGSVLEPNDLAVISRPPAELPRGAPSDATALLGQALAGPVVEGEVLTPVRLRGRGLLTGQPLDVVAVGVPLADATLVGSLRVGDSVSVHGAGAGAGAGAAAEVTQGTVLSVSAADPSSLTGRSGGASVVLAVSRHGATALASGMDGRTTGFVLALHQ